ncbi:hypothetical protein [Acinetobacter junii]|uniref:hypothetical protein n=1 Tax=Acinetobacter junii TaxID=40215 RepID=UPI001FB3BA36|nr:hypothetical protein [Acinetobacter junii]UOB51253.1 hypothetical protein MRY16_08885 [Acinetobacter junii]
MKFNFSLDAAIIVSLFTVFFYACGQNYLAAYSVGWLGLKQLCKGGYTSNVQSADSGGELKAYDTDILGRDSGKKFNEFNFEQQGRLIEFWFDACYLQNVNPSRPHHIQSLKLLGYVERILRDFILNPHDKSLLPSS